MRISTRLSPRSKLLVRACFLASLLAVVSAGAPAARKLAAASNGASARNVLTVIDPSLHDWQVLNEAARATTVLVLRRDRDPLEQILTTLETMDNVHTVNVFAHGTPGALHLATRMLTADSLDREQELLRAIRSHLAPGADLLLYGCDIGQGELGQEFVEKLARVAGVDVAASSNLTGEPRFGGDWDLEVRRGRIESVPLRVPRYPGVLSIVSFTSEDADYTSTTITKTVAGKTLTFSGGEGNGGLGVHPWFGPLMLWAYDDYVHDNVTRLAISIESGQTFDISSFSLGVFDDDVAVELTYAGGSTASFTISQTAYTYTTVSSFSIPINDVKMVVLTSQEPAMFQNFDITDVKAIASAPTVTTSAASSVIASGAILNGVVNDNGFATSVSFDYGLDATYGDNAAATTGGTLGAGAGSTAVAKTLTGLACNTTYHFRARAVSSAGTTPGSDATFTTGACVPGAPTIGAATAGDAQAFVTFTVPASNGGAAIAAYTATSNPGGLTGTCAGPSACVITVAGLTNGTAYTFTVTATNSAGAGLASSPSNSVVYDVTAPTVTDGNMSLNRTIFRDGDTVTATWNNTSAGDNNLDIASAIFDFSAFGASSVAATNAGGVWTAAAVVDLPAGGTGLNVSLTVTDTNENAITAADSSNATIDNASPIMTIGAPSATVASNGPITYPITYSGADASTLTAIDVTLDTNGTATGVVEVSGSGATNRVVTVRSIAGDGSIGIRIAAATASDLSGNTANAENSAAFAVDNTVPAPVISSTEPSPTQAQTIEAAVSFGEIVSGFDQTDLVVTNGTIGNFQTSGSGSFTFDVTPQGDGTISVQIAAGIALDVAGNSSLASNEFRIVSLRNAPRPVITSTETSPSKAPLIPFVVDFGAIVSGFSESDLQIHGGGASSFTDNGAGRFGFTVAPAADGEIAISIRAGAAENASGVMSIEADWFRMVSDRIVAPPVVSGFVPETNALGGTGEPAASLRVSRDSSEPAICTTVVSPTSLWNCVLGADVDFSHALTIVQTDAAGNVSAPVEFSFDDGDGISLSEELAGPHQITDANGNHGADANDDGLVDAFQSNVATMTNPEKGTALSMDIRGTNPETGQPSTCTKFDFIQALSIGDGMNQGGTVPGDAGFQYPFGLVNYAVKCAAGASDETITMVFYFYQKEKLATGNLPVENFVVRKFAAGSGFFDPRDLGVGVGLEDDAALAAKAGVAQVLKMTLTLKDNGAGDDNPLHNVLLDPVGLAVPAQGSVWLQMTANKRQVSVGDIVQYQIRANNATDVALSDVFLQNLLPAGFQMVPGSPRLIVANQTSALAADVNARNIRLGSFSIPASSSVTIAYSALVGSTAQPGARVNAATAVGALGDISATASVSVDVIADPILDRMTVLGRVFNDRNGNGRMDEGEDGIAGARIITTNGEWIVADEFGRYNDPGVDAGPSARGRNFILKVDADSLPKGAAFTTENPRVERITGGAITRMDFGVRLPDAPESAPPADEPKKRDFSMVGLADFTVGQNDVKGAAGASPGYGNLDEGLFTDGRLAFYLKTRFSGRYHLSAQVDTGEDSIGSVWNNMSKRDPRDLFRRIDPDRYFPTYGDNSTRGSDVNSEGKLFVRLDWDKSSLLWGNFNTGFTGTKLGEYSRGLYGARVNLRTSATTAYGDEKTILHAFTSESNTAAAHDEFEGTGGSLYYLRHQDVVLGSMKLSVEVRESLSNRVRERIDLSQGPEYDIDEFQGRLILTEPLRTTAARHLLTVIRDEALDGDRVILVADYEYTSAASFIGNNVTGGVRAKTWFGDRIGIGGTYIRENESPSDFEKRAGDITLRGRKNTYLSLEYAESEAGQAVDLGTSSDGGLTFSGVGARASARRGNAMSVEGRLDFSDYFGEGVSGKLGAWFNNEDAGFDSLAVSTNGTRRQNYGLEGFWEASSALRLSARYSQDEGGGYTLKTSGAQADYRFNAAFSVSTEYRHREGTSFPNNTSTLPNGSALAQHGDIVGARLRWRASDRWSSFVSGQFAANDPNANDANSRNNLFGLGTEYQVTDKLSVLGEAFTGRNGYGVRTGANFNYGKESVAYLNYTTEGDLGLLGGLTLGNRSQLSDKLKIYQEYRYDWQGLDPRKAQSYGMAYSLTSGWSVNAEVQAGRVKQSGQWLDRDAYSVSSHWKNGRASATSKLEYRQTDSLNATVAVRQRQWVTANRFSVKVNEDVSLMTKFDYAISRGASSNPHLGRFGEFDLGAAYRPVKNNRLNLLAMYSYSDNMEPQSEAANAPQERGLLADRFHVASLDGSYEWTSRWETGFKLAWKRSAAQSDRGDGEFFGSNTKLAIARARYHFVHRWNAMVEFRDLAVGQLHDRRRGFLSSLGYEFTKNMQGSMGYNFTDFNDDLKTLNFNARGWFVNMAFKY